MPKPPHSERGKNRKAANLGVDRDTSMSAVSLGVTGSTISSDISCKTDFRKFDHPLWGIAAVPCMFLCFSTYSPQATREYALAAWAISSVIALKRSEWGRTTPKPYRKIFFVCFVFFGFLLAVMKGYDYWNRPLLLVHAYDFKRWDIPMIENDDDDQQLKDYLKQVYVKENIHQIIANQHNERIINLAFDNAGQSTLNHVSIDTIAFDANSKPFAIVPVTTGCALDTYKEINVQVDCYRERIEPYKKTASEMLISIRVNTAEKIQLMLVTTVNADNGFHKRFDSFWVINP